MLEPRRLLVLAPHPDDDVIGCGGLIAATAARGGAVRVIYVTDGSASHPGSLRFPRPRLAAIREAEAREALNALGVEQEPVFFGYADGGLPGLAPGQRRELTGRLRNELAEFAPDLVALPWPREPHPDHAATARYGREALRMIDSCPAISYYAVWLGEFGSPRDFPQRHEAVAIDYEPGPANRARKRLALSAHRSQFGCVVDDDPGFCIDAALAERWLAGKERHYVIDAAR